MWQDEPRPVSSSAKPPRSSVVDWLDHLQGGWVEVASKTDWAGHPEKKIPGRSGES